jgi:GTP cyclohydrolase FolE2
MTVGLDASEKGTHMSRFIELLEARTEALTMQRFQAMVVEMLHRLDAPAGAMEELIGVAERSASSELYGLLKRPDEKYVTERAYDNPRFVEDLVREVALALNQDDRVGAYVVEADNFESIHNHSAKTVARYALAGRAPTGAPDFFHSP